MFPTHASNGFGTTHGLRQSLLIILLFLAAGCTSFASGDREATAPAGADRRLLVVATTSIIADVAGEIGGEHIDLISLLPPGADPHGYQPTPRDLRSLSDADLILINGLGLEAGMASVLDEFADKFVSVNQGVTVQTLDEEDPGHVHDESVDPHTWYSIDAVEQWSRNIADALTARDPANARSYADAADDYVSRLEALKEELASVVAGLPVDRRKLVSDHEALGYLARDFGFTVVGAVIPGFSTLTEPSAQQLATIQDQIEAEQIGAIFVDISVSPQLQQQLATDLGIEVVPIYSGSLSAAEGPAPTYIEFMRYNINRIVAALQ